MRWGRTSLGETGALPLCSAILAAVFQLLGLAPQDHLFKETRAAQNRAGSLLFCPRCLARTCSRPAKHTGSVPAWDLPALAEHILRECHLYFGMLLLNGGDLHDL